MNTIINQESTLKQKYIRDGLDPAAAFEKARAVLELIAELRGRCPDLSEGELLRQAEQEATAGERAIRDYIDRVQRPAKLTTTPTAQGLYLERGEQWLLLSARECAALVDQIKGLLAADRKAQKQRRIHGRRLADGRDSGPWAVVAGRKAESAA
jgi:hypothetical protein